MGPTLLAIRTVSDEEGCRVGVTLTRDGDRLIVWRAEEDENLDLYETPVMRGHLAHDGIEKAIAFMNGLGSLWEIPNDLVAAIREHPFTTEECFARDPALAGALALGEMPAETARTLADVIFT